MNYAANPLPACCCSCGDTLPDEPHAGEGDGACAECFGESQVKAAAQLEKERGEQFRWLSGEWFRTAHLVRLPFNSRSGRYYTRVA